MRVLTAVSELVTRLPEYVKGIKHGRKPHAESIRRGQLRVRRYMNFRPRFSLFSNELAIDLGTANTLVYAKGRGIVVNEPSIVDINKATKQIEAVDKEAREMLGQAPGHSVAITHEKDGDIALITA